VSLGLYGGNSGHEETGGQLNIFLGNERQWQDRWGLIKRIIKLYELMRIIKNDDQG
jgi:hypothetical protein